MPPPTPPPFTSTFVKRRALSINGQIICVDQITYIYSLSETKTIISVADGNNVKVDKTLAEVQEVLEGLDWEFTTL